MARVELIIPKMGESVSEATIISWSKNIGDMIEMDETIIEIATDKVDSEVPSTHEGKLVEMLFQADDVVKVGETFAILETEGESNDTPTPEKITTPEPDTVKVVEETVIKAVESTKTIITNSADRFYSPLVKSMASSEGIEMSEMEVIPGSGKDGRVTKSDMISYIKTRGSAPTATQKTDPISVPTPKVAKYSQQISGDTEIIEMDRMRKLISTHMTMSKQTSAHITSFVEADMTNIVNWRNKIKDDFKKREGQNITFTPIIIEAMAKAVKDFPMINVSVKRYRNSYS